LDLVYATGTPNPTDQFWIIDGGVGSAPVAGKLSFAGVPLNDNDTFTTVNGITYKINYNLAGDPLGTGNDVVLTTTAVPEPATIGLAGLAVVGLLSRRRRIRR